jgi:hypothetical protein
MLAAQHVMTACQEAINEDVCAFRCLEVESHEEDTACVSR